jgi:hypothetical protein
VPNCLELVPCMPGMPAGDGGMSIVTPGVLFLLLIMVISTRQDPRRMRARVLIRRAVVEKAVSPSS